jgi:hypothetical protein
MATSILGLPSTDKFNTAGTDLGSIRRKTFLFYPQAGMTITGLSSLLDSEPLSHVDYYFHEERFRYLGSTTRGTNPLTKTAPSTGDANDGTVADTTSVSNIATANYLKVASTADYRVGQIVSIDPAGSNLQFQITAVTVGVADASLLGYLTVRPVRAIAAYSGTDYTAGTYLPVIATAYGQGSTVGKPLGTRIPQKIGNTVQLIRTPMKFTLEQMKTPMTFDASGPYKLEARRKIQEHFCQMEAAVLFGKRSGARRTVLNSADSGNDSDGSEIVYTMSGLLEYLRLWDAGATGLTIDGSSYAPYDDHAAVTEDTDPEKRFITNSSGVVNYTLAEGWMLKANTTSARTTSDRIGICGNNVLTAFNKMARLETNQILAQKDSVYGLNITTFLFPTGNLHLVTHPLFNDKMYGLQNSLLICDPTNLSIRPLLDTDLRTEIQNKKSLVREDEYVTEFGLEVHNVESNVFIKSCGTYEAE